LKANLRITLSIRWQNREQEKERLNAGKITDKNVTKKNKNEEN